MIAAEQDSLSERAKVWLTGYRRRDRASPALGEGEWRMLLSLAVHESPSVSSLAYGAGLSLTTGLRYCRMLERAGLVASQAHPLDARSRVIVLTKAGRDLLERAA